MTRKSSFRCGRIGAASPAMYGLLIENFIEYVKTKYGEEKWDEIRRLANIDQSSFSTLTEYKEDVLPRLAKKAVTVLGVSEEELMRSVGEFFVEFVGQYGYDRVFSVLGRHLRDFLNGLDNLHEYLKDVYPKMRPPSFFCESETSSGMLLHYRSKRKGYAHYTVGQIKEVARRFYNTDMEVVLLHENSVSDTMHVTFQLTFDNRAFAHQPNLTLVREEQNLPLKGNILFEIFPFCILFGRKMEVQYIGNSLMQTMPDLVHKRLTDWFDLSRPHVEFTFDEILKRTNNIFELLTKEHVYKNREKLNGEIYGNGIPVQDLEINDKGTRHLKLRGQMIFMEEWDLTLFLGTPVMLDLDSMVYSGLFINDLSMHDFSRDRMLAGLQQSAELKLALSQEQMKSKKLEESMRKLDEEMRRTDELLYQMIPMQVAQRLRNGENPVDTCETFESVTILFSDVVNFTSICSRITPMAVVSMLNEMYSIFDNLTEKHGVYKVETIGDAYMVVAGAPERQANHGEMVCNMALDMVEAITKLKDPYTGNHLRIRVGVHTGTVVAGVVGLKMPRYCLFGDAVNTASRMESTSEAMKVHISQTTKDTLSPRYRVEERKEVTVKGKGDMNTYWLLSCDGRVSCIDTVTLPQTIEGNDFGRRRSAASANYSPILLGGPSRIPLSTTPTPTLQTPSHPTPEVIKPRVTGETQTITRVHNARTFSNAGFDNGIIPFVDAIAKPSSVGDISTASRDLLGERPHSHSFDKPSSAPSTHYGNHSILHSFSPPYHTSSASQHTLVPDVLIDNHFDDEGTFSESSPTPPTPPPTAPPEHTPHVKTVDRGTSPIVSHASCSGFSAKNRVHSHTCVIL